MIVHPTTATPEVQLPDSLPEAIELLKPEEARALAGGTWVMRGEVHGEGYAPVYVLVSRLPELNRLEFTDDGLVIGAAVTHDRLAAFLAGDDRFAGLRTAARKSANPAIRRMATLGGNVSTVDFFAADLNPALLALAAEVGLAGAGGARSILLEEFLRDRERLLPDHLVIHVTVPLPRGVSAHERLTMRRAGDYPMVIVDVHAELDAEGVVREARVALGSIEPVARLWPEFAATLAGSRLDPEAAEAAARALVDGIDARDGVEAAGWYRRQILPALVKRAIGALQRKAESR